MSTVRRHLVFVDDDPWELDQFRKLYEGDQFRVTTVHAESIKTAVATIGNAVGDATIDLFVLDLFYPSVEHPPSELDPGQRTVTRHAVEDITKLAQGVEAHYGDPKKLLRASYAVMRRAGDLLDDLCRMLRQSPEGGIALLKELEVAYPKVPKVFYSRKATLKDAKQALAAGALDVISKPEADAHHEAQSIAEQFKEAADHKPPRWGREWLGKAGKVIREWGPLGVELAKMLAGPRS